MDQIKFVTGLIFTIIGILLLLASVFFVFLLIYGIPVFVIGIALLLNLGREDKIEKIKKVKKKRR